MGKPTYSFEIDEEHLVGDTLEMKEGSDVLHFLYFHTTALCRANAMDHELIEIRINLNIKHELLKFDYFSRATCEVCKMVRLFLTLSPPFFWIAGPAHKK